jgi:hypothetical protein
MKILIHFKNELLIYKFFILMLKLIEGCLFSFILYYRYFHFIQYLKKIFLVLGLIFIQNERDCIIFLASI